MSVLNKKGNKIMTTNFNFAKMRCRKLAWMTESVWGWYTPFIDAFNHLLPKHAVSTGDCIACKHNVMGGKFKEDQEPQGPPNE